MTKEERRQRKRNARQLAADHTKERAEFWDVHLRTMQQWKREGVPVDDVNAMLHWYRELPWQNQSRMSPRFQKRIDEVRRDWEQEHGRPHYVCPVWREFIAKRNAARLAQYNEWRCKKGLAPVTALPEGAAEV